MSAGVKEAENTVSDTKVFVIRIGLLSVMIGIVLSLLISKSISKPIKQAAEVIRKVADGDLQIKELKIKTKDEVGGLFKSYNKMVQDLRTVVSQIHIIFHKCCFK